MVGTASIFNRAAAGVCRQAQKDAPKYSRLEAEISAMQRNSSTYCDQPEDAEDFARWLEVPVHCH